MGALLVATAAAQVSTLVDHLPAYARQVRHVEPRLVAFPQPIGITAAKLHTTEQQAIAALQGVGTTAAKDSLSLVSGVLGTLVDLILILNMYLTANGPRLARAPRRETPGTQRWRGVLAGRLVLRILSG